MNNRSDLSRLFLVFALWIGLCSGALAQNTAPPERQHEPVTRQLMTMVEHDATLKAMLVESIALAKSRNPERRTNPAQSLEEYYDFIDWAAKAMPWSILPNPPARYSTLYDQIDQSFDYFYYVNDQPLASLVSADNYNNSLQYHEPYRSWLIQFVKQWGIYLSTKDSWNDDYYRRALADPAFGLQKGWYESPSNWKTFNDFFARRLKSPDQRPIASPGDSSVIASPADSRPQGVWKIDGHSNIVDGVRLKSNVFRSVAALIGQESAYKDAFADGTLTHTFLDVNDYHRYHFPLSGTVKEVRIIPADDAVGGVTTWDAAAQKYVLSSGTPGWQNIETRGCVILETKEYGLVALLPIGMSQVSSINFEAGVKPGQTFRKGEMLGYFLFGGSDFVILFQENVKFQLTVPRGETGEYDHLLMGQEFGRVSLKR